MTYRRTIDSVVTNLTRFPPSVWRASFRAAAASGGNLMINWFSRSTGASAWSAVLAWPPRYCRDIFVRSLNNLTASKNFFDWIIEKLTKSLLCWQFDCVGLGHQQIYLGFRKVGNWNSCYKLLGTFHFIFLEIWWQKNSIVKSYINYNVILIWLLCRKCIRNFKIND